MDQLAIEPALHALAGDRDFDVIPMTGLDVARLAIESSIGFDGVFGISPTADIPPSAPLIVVDVEQDQEALCAGNLPRLQRDGVVCPGLVARNRPDERLFHGLAQRSLLNLPLAL